MTSAMDSPGASPTDSPGTSPETQPAASEVHPAWLPAEAFRAVGSRRVAVDGDPALVGTVLAEVTRACERFGGNVGPGPDAELELALRPVAGLGPEDFELSRAGGLTVVAAAGPAGLLYGLFHVVRLGAAAFGPERPRERHRPARPRRMLDHWDNVDVHPVMGQVERGYSGGSLFWCDGRRRADLSRVDEYARLLAACGINAISVNNVNVHATEAHLLTSRLGDVAAIAARLRPYHIRVFLSVSFVAPMRLGGLATADPLDERVGRWWATTTARVYAAIPDFGGYVIKADSEGQPGPFAYGRSHADGANVLADALQPFGGVVCWRAFVYNHRQDWRDRGTDRARAAHDHFAPLDGRFRDNVVVQVKHGPIDFQTREPVSPVVAALPATRVAVEFQVTQEYTGQQRHVCYLGPMWSEVLGFAPFGDERTVADLADGLVAVSNAGTDVFWTGHPLAQANLYAFGRLAWDPALDPVTVLDEWIDLTFAAPGDPLRRTLHAMMDGSWRVYEQYTAPLGIGFMVRPGDHYGPDVDGYEYTPWGTYHFADRDGVGVDRTRATGTGFTGQYPPPWSDAYESPARCPDELLLFFHHAPYGHVLHSGVTVIQHIYDTHFAGVEAVRRMRQLWTDLPTGPNVTADAHGTADAGGAADVGGVGGAAGAGGAVDPATFARVAELLDEQLRCAQEWCDQINTYFHRKSGVPDAHGRRIH